LGEKIKREGEKKIWREREMEIRKEKCVKGILFLFLKKCCYT